MGRWITCNKQYVQYVRNHKNADIQVEEVVVVVWPVDIHQIKVHIEKYYLTSPLP